MVRWLSPSALFFTAVDVVISGIFGRYADKRELEGAIDVPEPLPAVGDSIWIDYIADVGDGWNSTYTMAWLLAQDPARMSPPDGALRGTEPGGILIFGGDQVYPKAGAEEYATRLLGPYEAAAAGPLPAARTVFAIPGNHDWYDGLTSFMRVFCRNQHFAGREAPQKRSYFAKQLPHRWWVLGIDIAFDYYIDEAQLTYFRGLRCMNRKHRSRDCGGRIHAGDRIILCTAKPGWEEARLSGDFRSVNQRLGRQALHKFELEITQPADDRNGWGCKLRLVLSGNLHHYVRYAADDPSQPQRITAGGGGAFFYPTHVTASRIPWPSDEPEEPPVIYERKSTFPDPKVSRRWRWLIPFAPVLANPSFAVMVGVIYLVLSLVTPGSIHAVEDPTSVFGSAAPADLLRLWMPPTARPMFVILGLLVLLGLYAFADSRTKLGAIFLMAIPHWIVQMYALTVSISVGATLATRWLPDSAWDTGVGHLPFVVVAAALVGVVGGIAGGLVMGMYLLLAQLLDRHPNEAFAAMHMASYKNFIRLHLDGDGLTVYPMGVRRVCKRWRETSPEGGGPELAPADCPITELIESPIRIEPDP